MRTLLDWVQIHPALGRVQAHQGIAAEDGDNHTISDGLRERDLDVDTLDAMLAATPPSSVAELLDLVASALGDATGNECTPQEPPSPLIDEEEDVGP